MLIAPAAGVYGGGIAFEQNLGGQAFSPGATIRREEYHTVSLYQATLLAPDWQSSLLLEYRDSTKKEGQASFAFQAWGLKACAGTRYLPVNDSTYTSDPEIVSLTGELPHGRVSRSAFLGYSLGRTEVGAYGIQTLPGTGLYFTFEKDFFLALHPAGEAALFYKRKASGRKILVDITLFAKRSTWQPDPEFPFRKKETMPAQGSGYTRYQNQWLNFEAERKPRWDLVYDSEKKTFLCRKRCSKSGYSGITLQNELLLLAIAGQDRQEHSFRIFSAGIRSRGVLQFSGAFRYYYYRNYEKKRNSFPQPELEKMLQEKHPYPGLIQPKPFRESYGALRAGVFIKPDEKTNAGIHIEQSVHTMLEISASHRAGALSLGAGFLLRQRSFERGFVAMQSPFENSASMRFYESQDQIMLFHMRSKFFYARLEAFTEQKSIRYNMNLQATATF